MTKFEKVTKGDDTELRNKYGFFSKKDLETQLKDDHLTVKKLGERHIDNNQTTVMM